MLHKGKALNDSKEIKKKKLIAYLLDKYIYKNNTNEYLSKSLDCINLDMYSTFKNIGMKEQYLKRFNNGEDVYLNAEEMREIFT